MSIRLDVVSLKRLLGEIGLDEMSCTPSKGSYGENVGTDYIIHIKLWHEWDHLLLIPKEVIAPVWSLITYSKVSYDVGVSTD